MGKIADRLARKSDPLYDQARAIVRQASAFEQDFDDDEFDRLKERLDSALGSLTPQDFERLLGMVTDAAAPRRDGEGVLDSVFDAIQSLCETLPGIDGAPDSYLVSIPLVAKNGPPIWGVRVSATQGAGLAQVLKDFDLVEESASVVFLPRILRSLEADLLQYGDVYRLNRVLAQGNLDEALELIAQANIRIGYGRHGNEAGNKPGKEACDATASVGVLVALVKSSDLEPFPLAMELDHALDSLGGRDPFEDQDEDEDESEDESEDEGEGEGEGEDEDEIDEEDIPLAEKEAWDDV